MYSLNQVNKLVSCGRDPARSLPFWRGFLLIPLILVWLAFAPNAQTNPDPASVGGSLNTADGFHALFNVTGTANAAFGWNSMLFDQGGNFNTAAGAGTLALNNADANTACGTAALILNVLGGRNTAVGAAAMVNNAGTLGGEGSFNGAVGAFALNQNVTTGSFNTGAGAGTLALNNADANTGVGTAALILNIYGGRNTAVGAGAMVNNAGDVSRARDHSTVLSAPLRSTKPGFSNNAMGDSAMFRNQNGAANTAVGDLAMENNDSSGNGDANFNCAFGAQALEANVNGDSNNAVGAAALSSNLAGLFNQAMGAFALSGNTVGASNIAIGDSAAANNGTGSFNTVIGDLAGPDIGSGGDNIYVGAGAGTGVGDESQTIRIGEHGFIGACFIQGISGVGVSGDPVVVDGNGQLGTAAAGSPLSLKEVVKERQVVQQLKATTEKQAARIALQENQIQTLTVALKQQAEQIQKVSAQLEMVRPAPRVVGNR